MCRWCESAMDITGGGGPAWNPTPHPPPLVTKSVTIFGHNKNDLKPAVKCSPQPVHVHGRGSGDVTTHMTGTEPCGCNIANAIQCHSMSLNAITPSDTIVLLAATTTTHTTVTVNSIAYLQDTSKREGAQSVNHLASHEVIKKTPIPPPTPK